MRRTLNGKIRDQLGERRFGLGLATTIISRQRGYFSLVALAFLVVNKLLEIFDVDLGLADWLSGLPGWAWLLASAFGLVLFMGWVYFDLKFILPGEKATNTGRDPVINDLREDVRGIRKILDENKIYGDFR